MFDLIWKLKILKGSYYFSKFLDFTNKFENQTNKMQEILKLSNSGCLIPPQALLILQYFYTWNNYYSKNSQILLHFSRSNFTIFLSNIYCSLIIPFSLDLEWLLFLLFCLSLESCRVILWTQFWSKNIGQEQREDHLA